MKNKVKYQLVGWLFFIICSVFYTVSGFISKDYFVAVGSIIFFLACVFFVISLFIKD